MGSRGSRLNVRTSSWSVDSTGCRVGGLPGGARRSWPASRVGMARDAERGRWTPLAAPPRARAQRTSGEGAFRAAALAGISSLRGADAPRQRHDRPRIGPRPIRLEAPGHRGGRRVGKSVANARRDQGPSPGRDDDRATMHRGLERGHSLGRAGWPTWPGSRDWRLAAADPPIRSAMPATCSTTSRSRHPTASITSGSTWPAPSSPRPCSVTRWMAGP